MLTPDQKLNRLESSRVILARFHSDPAKILRELWPGMKNGYIILTLNKKKQNKQWKHAGSPPSKKLKGVPSVGKWLPCPGTAKMCSWLKEASISCVLVFCCSRTMHLFTHTSSSRRSGKKKSGFELLPHEPYSPYLAPSEVYVFQKLKHLFQGRHLDSDNGVILVLGGWFSNNISMMNITYFVQ